MDAAFVAGVTRRAHRIGADAADVGGGQEDAVEQRAQAVVLEHGGALDLGEKARPKGATQGPAGVVGTEAEQEGRRGGSATERAQQPGYAFTRAAQGVDVDLERDPRHAGLSVSR